MRTIATDSLAALRERASTARLGPAGRRVVSYLERHPVEALAGSAGEIAVRTSTSDATVVRTVQALGFSGMAELKRSLLEATGAAVTPAEAMQRTLGAMTLDANAAIEIVLRMHEEGMAALRSSGTRARIAEAALLLHHLDRLVIFGIGPSAGLAAFVATLLRRSGRRSAVIDRTGSMLADQLLDLKPGDGLVLLAYGRIYREVRVIVMAAKERGLPIILFTEDASSRLAGLADKVVAIPRGRPGHIALHGAVAVALEALVLALAAAATDKAIASLERLGELRRALAE